MVTVRYEKHRPAPWLFWHGVGQKAMHHFRDLVGGRNDPGNV